MTDFSKGKRGPLIVDPDKTRVTILLDNKILDHFRDKADKAGHGYNQMINDILLAHIREGKVCVSQDALKQVLEALTGPGHLVRELRVIQTLPGDDPITTLIKEFNDQ